MHNSDRMDVGRDCVSRGPVTSGEATLALNPYPPKHEIRIMPQDYGFVVNVGCKTVVIETKEKLIEKLMTYLNDPVGTERKFNSGELFK